MLNLILQFHPRKEIVAEPEEERKRSTENLKNSLDNTSEEHMKLLALPQQEHRQPIGENLTDD